MTTTGTGVGVRPLTDDDDLDALTGDHPFGWAAHAWKQMADDSADLELHGWVGLLDDQPAGVALAIPQPFASEGYGVAILNVLPEHRRRGVGGALRQAIHGALRGRVPGVHAEHAESDEDALAAIAAWGLKGGGFHQESYLDLTSLDRAHFERLASIDGVDLLTTSDLDDAGWRELYDFIVARTREAPDTDGTADWIPFETFRSSVDAPFLVMTAERDGHRLAVTHVMRRPGSTTQCNTWFTGVVAEGRGLGLATALKARQALEMADGGVQRLFTQNMDGNEPILRANARLGFQAGIRYGDVTEALST